jgi:hypothetical protein
MASAASNFGRSMGKSPKLRTTDSSTRRVVGKGLQTKAARTIRDERTRTRKMIKSKADRPATTMVDRLVLHINGNSAKRRQWPV